MIHIEAIKVPYPSDIKIMVQDIKDEKGNDVDISLTYLKFLFSDECGHQYCCIYDPIGENSKHTIIENGILFILLEKYELKKGSIYCQLFTKQTDSAFEDGYWNIASQRVKTGLTII